MIVGEKCEHVCTAEHTLYTTISAHTNLCNTNSVQTNSCSCRPVCRVHCVASCLLPASHCSTLFVHRRRSRVFSRACGVVNLVVHGPWQTHLSDDMCAVVGRASFRMQHVRARSKYLVTHHLGIQSCSRGSGTCMRDLDMQICRGPFINEFAMPILVCARSVHTFLMWGLLGACMH